MPPMNPANATKLIRDCAAKDTFGLRWTGHSKERLLERNLVVGDLLWLLKNGFVLDEGEESTREGVYKYNIEGRTPNTEGRVLCAVVIPDGKCNIKIVTIMWKDEKR